MQHLPRSVPRASVSPLTLFPARLGLSSLVRPRPDPAEDDDHATVGLSDDNRPPTLPTPWENVELIWEEHVGIMDKIYADEDRDVIYVM